MQRSLYAVAVLLGLIGSAIADPSPQEIAYRKCLSAVGPRQSWAPGFENCPAIIRAWRAGKPKEQW